MSLTEPYLDGTSGLHDPGPATRYNGIDYNKDKAWIQSRSGAKIHLLNPTHGSFKIEDIAYGLSNVCRFAGHTRKFYSVAEHSVRVADLIAEWKFSKGEQYDGLMHDTPESVLSDIASPIKYLPELSRYRDIEHSLTVHLADEFGFSYPFPWMVKAADQVLLGTEARDLMAPVVDGWHMRFQHLDHKIRPWSPAKARRRFLAAYYRLNTLGVKSPKRFFFF